MASWSNPVVSDNCGETTLSVSQQPNTMFSVGSTFVTMFLSDNSGNSTQHSFTVTVIDSEAPILSGIPTDMTLSSDLGQCGSTLQTGNFLLVRTTVASVICLAVISPVSSSRWARPPSVTPSADSNGNLATGSFLITVIDNEAPVITGADDVFMRCTRKCL